MGYFKTCPLCGAHLDPDERCDCVKVYTGYPGRSELRVKMEGGKYDSAAVYIDQNEPNPGAVYCRALGYLEEHIKEAAPGAANAGDGRVEQIAAPVSASIVTE